jgi:hypothetical protein
MMSGSTKKIRAASIGFRGWEHIEKRELEHFA